MNSDPPNSLTAEHTRESIGHAVDLLDGEPAAAGHSLGEFTRLHFFEGLAVRHIATRWRQPTARMHELRRRACRRLRLLLEPLQR